MSARVQNALLKNVRLDTILQDNISDLDKQVTLKLNTLRHEKNQVYTWQKEIKTKSSNFTLTSKKELQNMIANKNDYMTGKWTSFKDGANIVRRRNRVLRNYKEERPLAEQIGRIKNACRAEKVELFDIITQINRNAADRARRNEDFDPLEGIHVEEPERRSTVKLRA